MFTIAVIVIALALLPLALRVLGSLFVLALCLLVPAILLATCAGAVIHTMYRSPKRAAARMHVSRALTRTSTMTYQEYHAQLEALAIEITKEARAEERDISDVLHETLDQHEYVISTDKALAVLQHSTNESAYFDDFGDVTASDFSSLVAKLALSAMLADVQARSEFDAK